MEKDLVEDILIRLQAIIDIYDDDLTTCTQFKMAIEAREIRRFVRSLSLLINRIKENRLPIYPTSPENKNVKGEQPVTNKIKRFVRVIAQSKGKRFSEISRYLWTDKSDGEIYEIFENEFETKLITELFNSSATNLLTIIGKGNGTWMVTESKQIKINNELASLYQVKFDGYADCIACDESEEWVREYRIENFAKKAKFNGVSKLFDFKENDVRILQSGNELIRVKGE